MCCSSGEKPRLSKSGFMLRSGLVRATVLQFCGSQIWETSWRAWGGQLSLSSSESTTSNAGLKDGSGCRVGGGQFSFSRDWEVLEMNADSQTKKNNTKSTKEVEEVFITNPKQIYQQAHAQHKTTHLVAGTTWTRQEEPSKVSPQGDEGDYHPSTGCEEDVELSAVTFSVVVVVVCSNRAKSRGCLAWLVEACRVLAESQAAWKCQGNLTQRLGGLSTFLKPASKAEAERRAGKKRKNTEEEDGEEKGERERPVKKKKNIALKATQSSPAVQCHLRLPPLSSSSPWCPLPVESMGSALWRETQTKTDRYSNKSLVGWFL